MGEIINIIASELGISPALAIAYLFVTALVVIMAVVAAVMKIMIWIRYRRANKMPISNEMTGIETAQYVLDREGLSPQVTVRKAGFIREAIFGNYYNVVTKKIYLRSVLGKIDKKTTVTATALAVQKVAIAKLCESGDTQAITRGRLQLAGLFGPFLFIPIVLIGAVLDILLMNGNGVLSLGSIALSGLILVFGFIVTFLNIPVEKRANELALQLLEKHGLATGDEIAVMRTVYETYITSYICDFILELLRIIQWILELFIKAKSSK